MAFLPPPPDGRIVLCSCATETKANREGEERIRFVPFRKFDDEDLGNELQVTASERLENR